MQQDKDHTVYPFITKMTLMTSLMYTQWSSHEAERLDNPEQYLIFNLTSKEAGPSLFHRGGMKVHGEDRDKDDWDSLPMRGEASLQRWW